MNRPAAICLAVSLAAPLVRAQSPLFSAVSGTFPAQSQVASGVSAFFDADGDGDLDLLAGLTFFENVDSGPLQFEAVSGVLPISSMGASDGVSVARTGDLEGDGDLDLFLLLTRSTDPVVVLVNDGTGTFGLASVPSTTNDVSSIDVADVDGDGDLDVYLGRSLNLFADSDQFWIQDASGVFNDEIATRMPALTDGATTGVHFADIDADGDADLLLSFQAPGILGPRPPEMWRNDGSGTFSSAPGTLPPRELLDMVSGDVDADGDLDLVAKGRSTPFEFLYLNDGSGAFADSPNAQFRPLDPTEQFLAVVLSASLQHQFVDVDGDGDQDLVGSVLSTSSVRLNDGAGGFATEAPSHPANNVSALGDVDLDGDLDVFDGRSLFTQTSSGGFQDRSVPIVLPLQRIVSTASPVEFALRDGAIDLTPALAELAGASAADFDGDGDFDVLVTGEEFTVTNEYRIRLAILENSGGVLVPGTEVVSDPVEHNAPARGPQTRVGDVDGDGVPEILVLPAESFGTFSIGARPRLFVLGSFGQLIDESATRLPPTALSSPQLELIDVDGDGDLDLFIPDAASSRLYANDGAGNFSDVSATLPPAVAGEAIGLVESLDVEGDGDQDLLLSVIGPGPAGALRWLRTDVGVGLVDAGLLPATVPTAFAPVVRAGDVDEDGDDDLIVAVRSASGPTDFSLYRADGSGGFVVEPSVLVPPASGTAFVFEDIDRDGDPDLVVGDSFVAVNLRRQTELVDLLRLDLPATLRLHGRSVDPSTTSILFVPFFGLLPDRIPTPFGELGMDPVALAQLPAQVLSGASGSVDLSLLVPNDAGLYGLEFLFQTLVLDVGSSALPALSNTLATQVF